METRIQLEKFGKPAEEVTELVLDNCKETQVSGLTDEFHNLRYLSLYNVGLSTLKGFPSLPKLERLQLGDNRISGGLNLLNGCPNIMQLSLSGNKIMDITTLEPLKSLEKLQRLDLFNCEVTNVDNYREQVFGMLPCLTVLDGAHQGTVGGSQAATRRVSFSLSTLMSTHQQQPDGAARASPPKRLLPGRPRRGAASSEEIEAASYIARLHAHSSDEASTLLGSSGAAPGAPLDLPVGKCANCAKLAEKVKARKMTIKGLKRQLATAQRLSPGK